MNQHALRVLEFPAVLELVASRATSELGKAAVRALEPSADRDRVEGELARLCAQTIFEAVVQEVREDEDHRPTAGDPAQVLERSLEIGPAVDGAEAQDLADHAPHVRSALLRRNVALDLVAEDLGGRPGRAFARAG